jgi:hypothetical protein
VEYIPEFLARTDCRTRRKIELGDNARHQPGHVSIGIEAWERNHRVFEGRPLVWRRGDRGSSEMDFSRRHEFRQIEGSSFQYLELHQMHMDRVPIGRRVYQIPNLDCAGPWSFADRLKPTRATGGVLRCGV